jgi:hypothetical protein
MTVSTITRTATLSVLVFVTMIALAAPTTHAGALFGTVSDFLIGDFYSVDPTKH